MVATYAFGLLACIFLYPFSNPFIIISVLDAPSDQSDLDFTGDSPPMGCQSCDDSRSYLIEIGTEFQSSGGNEGYPFHEYSSKRDFHFNLRRGKSLKG